MRWVTAIVALFCGVLVVAGTSSALPRNDHLLYLDKRAGPYRYLDGFSKGRPDAYTAALNAFGRPNSFLSDGNLCHVKWAGAGVTVGFASAAPSPCAASNLFTSSWYGMSLFGARWHTLRGLRVGSTIQQVRKLYPGAKFEGSLLALLHRRDQELLFTTLGVKVDRLGRVTSIEVPAGYIY